MIENAPKTLEETYEFLLDLCEKNPSNLKTLGEKSEATFGAITHMGIGRWMRNEWGLWSKEGELYKWFKSLGINHPDDMSAIILDSFYRYWHHDDIKLNEQVNYYKSYWKEYHDR